MNPRSIVAVMLCFTVCAVILSSVFMALTYPPGTVTAEFRDKIFGLIIYIAGIVSGWLLGKEKEPPK